jgi:putative ABC transport system ATP-binding protein
MDTPTTGDVNVCGVNLTNKNDSQLTKFRKENIGYIFQQYGLLPNLSVSENVEIGKDLQPDKSRAQSVDKVLYDLGIYEQRNKMPHELSGGQQQRVSIARSIAKNPNIIFADEPTGAVDESMSKHIMNLLIDINKKNHTTIVIVTHNPIIAQLATKIILVGNGTISKIIDNQPKNIDDID